MFYNVLASKHCPATDIKTLQWGYSLPEFLKLKEYVEIMDSAEAAVNKDHELQQKRNQK